MRRVSKKEITIMICAMLCMLLLYLILSGSLKVNSSYRDVLSVEKYEKIADGDDWQVYISEKNDLKPYFVYKGNKQIKSNIHLKAVIYLGDDNQNNTKVIEWYPYCDKHFFLGEQRFFFIENFNNIKGISAKIIWNEYSKEQNYIAYIFSACLSDEDKEKSLKIIDTITINENHIKPKY